MTLGGRKTTGRPTAGASRPKKRGNILAARVGHLGLGRGQERLLKSPSLARLDTEAAGDQEEEVEEEAARERGLRQEERAYPPGCSRRDEREGGEKRNAATFVAPRLGRCSKHEPRRPRPSVGTPKRP